MLLRVVGTSGLPVPCRRRRRRNAPPKSAEVRSAQGAGERAAAGDRNPCRHRRRAGAGGVWGEGRAADRAGAGGHDGLVGAVGVEGAEGEGLHHVAARARAARASPRDATARHPGIQPRITQGYNRARAMN